MKIAEATNPFLMKFNPSSGFPLKYLERLPQNREPTDSRRCINNQNGRLKNYGNIMIKKTLLIPDILIYKSQLAAPRY